MAGLADAPFELAIVGGGPAGLFTAITAARAGLRAVVIDRSTPPIDKACGEGLMPTGAALLREAGVVVDPDGCAPFTGVTYFDGETVADAAFPAGGVGLGVRRIFLHRALVARAEALGVALRWKTAVSGLRGDGVDTSGGFIPARYLIGADGLHSKVRRWAQMASRPGRVSRFGVRRHFAMAPWSDRVEVYWARDVEAYVTPVGPERVGVAFLWSGRKARFDGLLAEFPVLGDRLGQVPYDSTQRGAGPLHQIVSAVVRDNVALVGDASGYLDALTGEGMALAFKQAKALVAAIQTGDLSRYAVAHRQIVRLPEALMHLLLFVERRPWLRRRVIRALAKEPEMFSRFLGVNDGSVGPMGLIGVGGIRMGGRILLG